MEKFWKEYIELDGIKRYSKLQHIAKAIDGLSILKDERLRVNSIKSIMKGYFDDLIEVMEGKNEKG